MVVVAPTRDSFEPAPELADPAYVSLRPLDMNGWRCGTAWDIRPRYESTRIGPIQWVPAPPPPPPPHVKAVLIRSSSPVNVNLELPAKEAADCFVLQESTSIIVWLRTKANGETAAFHVSSRSDHDGFTTCIRRAAEWIDVNQETPIGTEIVVGFDKSP